MLDQRASLAFGLVGLVLLTVSGLWLAVWFIQAFSEADKSVQASIIAALVAVTSLIFTYWKERTRSIKEAHREKKIEIYQIFFDLIFEVQNNMRKNPDLNEKLLQSEEFFENMMELKKGIISYGSPHVINAFAQWQLHSGDDVSNDSSKPLRDIGNVLLAMRKDIGLSNWGLDNLSIHQINVTDNLSELTNLSGVRS